MSVQAMGWVFEHSGHSGSTLLVLLTVANHARSDGTGAFPSLAMLCRETRMSERTVRYRLRELERSGELVRVGKGPNGQNKWQLPMGGQTLPGGNLEPGGGNPTSLGGQRVAPEPSEPSLNQPSSRSAPLATNGNGHQKEMFETVAFVCGYDLKAMTTSERGRVGRATKELLGIGEEPGEVRRFAADWNVTYPDAVLSPQAITNNWSSYCSGQMEQAGKRRRR